MSSPTKIKYEADLDLEFSRWIQGEVGGDRLKHCIQCGQCSALCPLSDAMDYSPRQVMRLAREGFKTEALSSYSIWLCASCYNCTVECPKEIKITEIMYKLKERAIKDGIYPRRFPTAVMVKNFAAMAGNHGRISEAWLMVRVFLGTNLFKAFGMAPLGIGLLRTGRISPKQESIRQRKDLQTLLRVATAPEEVKKP